MNIYLDNKIHYIYFQVSYGNIPSNSSTCHISGLSGTGLVSSFSVMDGVMDA